MAVVETPDRIMTTGGWGGENGGMGMLFMFALLFLFRGGGAWGGGDGYHNGGGYRGGHDGSGCGTNYKRYDADFDYLKRDNWDLQKENLTRGFQQQLAQQECCCKTNENINAVRCEIKDQGLETRGLMVALQKDATIAALQAENARLNALAGEDRIVHRLASMYGNGHHNGDRCGFPLRGFVEPIRFSADRDDDCRHRC
jgi:hypothetical protein